MSDFSPQAQHLLSTLREDAPSPADFTRIQAGLEAQLQPSVVEVPSTPSSVSGLAVKIGAGLLGVVGIVLTVAVSLQGAPEVSPNVVQEVPQVPAQQSAALPIVDEPESRPIPPPPTKRARSAPPAVVPSVEPPSTPVLAEAPASEVMKPIPSLTEELALLQTARTALANHEAHRALSLLDLYPARFSQGQLRDEYQAARALTLCNLGRYAEGLEAASQGKTSVYQSAIDVACKEK